MMTRTMISARPELVEGLSSLCQQQEGQGFDELSPYEI